MARCGLQVLTAGWLGFLTCLAFLTAAVGDENGDGAGTKETPAGCPSSPIDRYLMFVSTMDGRVSALNVGKEGEVEWSVDAGASLVSSSIGNIEMMQDGVKTRLIPSLDGALYQFDGENVEALPFTADTLLSSSFKFTDDSTIVGGKEASTFGIDPATGKLKYACTIGGCKKFTDDGATQTSQDILIVTRNTKTVRSVEMNSGSEKWNFSVGQHQIKYVRGTDQFNQITEGTPDIDEEVFITTCPEQEEERDWFDFSWMTESAPEVELRVVVPKGLVMAFSKTDPTQLLWQRKFDSSINSAWVLQKGELSEVSLFDEKNVPALSMVPEGEESPLDELQEVPLPALMYIGLHEGQMYVQPSVQLVEEVESTIKMGTTTSVAVTMPRVRWKPYIATAGSRTPAEVRPRNPLQITDESNPAGNGESSWHDQYPFDGGFYLFPDQTPVSLDPLAGNKTDFQSIRLSAMSWWKEVGALSVFLAFMIHVFFHKFVAKKSECVTIVRADSTSIADQITELQDQPVEAEPPKPEEYTSRYYGEFVQNACLGRGGFGVVFEAANRMDDCKYAIKRITLNDSDKARERVMREVKALAKLDNGGIVRYYQAWFESPPPGWQEERDRNSLDTESVTNTPMISSTGFRSKHPTPKHSPLHSSVKSPTILNFNQRNPFKLDSSFDHSKPFGGAGDSTMESDSEWAKSQNGRKGGSDGFLPRLQHSVDDSVTRSESGSFSEQSLHLQPPEDSLSVNFVDSSVSKSRSIHVPFTLYDKSDSNQRTSNLLDWDYENSVSVIFEDSGCAEKSTTEELSLSSSTSNCDVPQNVVMMEQGVRRSKSKSKSRSHRRSKSCDSVSSRKLGKSKLSKSFDDTWTMSKHKPPDNLDIFTTRDEINKKDTVAPTPTRKLYLYIQMQLCQRATLKDWMIQNSEHREPATLLDILDQIVCAVDYIHSTGLMHRDLKPSNIFFSLDGVVKVGDFGLVTEAEDQCIEPDLSSDTSPCHKHTDQVGTKLYMSPEQAHGGIYSEKVDIFALGVIFFEMFFPFGTQMERVNTLMRVRQLDFPQRFVKEKPQEHALVRQMLSAEPEKRPSTQEILQDPLLGQFESVRQALKSRRATNRSISTSSSSSA